MVNARRERRIIKTVKQHKEAMDGMNGSCIYSHIRTYSLQFPDVHRDAAKICKGKICDHYSCDSQHQLHILLLLINMYFSSYFRLHIFNEFHIICALQPPI